MTAKILVVDDDQDLLKLISIRLDANNYSVSTAESGEQALSLLPILKPDLVITDLKMDGINGMELFEQIHHQHPTLPVIILTAHGTIPEAVEATQSGVADFLAKPFESSSLINCIESALSTSGYTAAISDKTASWRENIISQSPLIDEMLSKIEKIAPTDASVLIQSESGTGKELLAQAIHLASKRSKHKFVPVNCAAIPESLFESELFGHLKGSFTGATSDHKGLFRDADKGTLFLDEIGDMPLSFQSKLLRVLQEKVVRPVGSTEVYPINVRVLSATHHNLMEAVEQGDFREDLYYRLNVLTLELPPLRNRQEDIPLLANHFLQKLLPGKRISFSQEAMKILIEAPWPGNIRQLLNIVEQCAILSSTPIIPTSLVENALNGQSSNIQSYTAAQNEFEREYFFKLMQMTAGNVTEAAKIAQKNRTELYRYLSKHHLEPKMFRAS
ncbi:MAG: sigma 54-interacting transcriptional regulator [Arenicella sp.]